MEIPVPIPRLVTKPGGARRFESHERNLIASIPNCFMKISLPTCLTMDWHYLESAVYRSSSDFAWKHGFLNRRNFPFGEDRMQRRENPVIVGRVDARHPGNSTVGIQVQSGTTKKASPSASASFETRHRFHRHRSRRGLVYTMTRERGSHASVAWNAKLLRQNELDLNDQVRQYRVPVFR